MASLLSGLAGSSWSRSSGLLASSQIANSDVAPMALQVVPKSLGPRIGKFRRAIRDQTVDGAGVPLASCTVHCFRTADDTEVDEQVSDASGNYEVSTYDAGPYYCVAYKAGAPDVTGATVNTLTGV